MSDTLGRHGVAWRFNFLAGLPFFDEDGYVEGYYGAEPKWREEDLTPEQESELQGWIAEHIAERPQDDPLWVRWATMEHNGVEHFHRKGKPLIERRPAYGYECLMCKGHIVNKNPGDFRFVGGPVDGMWFVTDGRPTWIVPVPAPISIAADDASLTDSLTMNTVTYYRHNDVYIAH